MRAVPLKIGLLFCLSTMASWATAQVFVEEGDPKSPEGITYSYEGVDILLVLDNSHSMKEEQEILAEQVYTLVGSLAHPVEGWPYPAIEDVHVGVVSTDMGLQIDGKIGNPDPNYGCGQVGDEGRLRTSENGQVLDLTGASIMCDETEIQCPKAWSCEQDGKSIGRCVPQGDKFTVTCPGQDLIVETKDDMETQIACNAMSVGIQGCGIEQQLAAGIAGVKNAAVFDDPDRMLVVLVISDEEDCSIASADLFESARWKDSESINLACNHPDNPEHYLLSIEEIRKRLIDLKGDEKAVVFAGIVGVPTKPTCEGRGSTLGGCLSEPEMELVQTIYDDTTGEYIAFRNACEHYQDGQPVTKAQPGRRYVELATLFGDNGYIFSICNQEWTPPMQRVAKTILRSMMLQNGSDGPPAAEENGLSARSSCFAASSLGTNPLTGLLTTLLALF